jgi:hypothetical protein
MCTVSWAPVAGGYSLHFNRDESRTRTPALPPAALEREGVRFLAPIDAEAGGTWIGTNQFGVTVSLLNRYHETPVEPDGPRTSRGLLVIDLLPATSALAVVARLGDRALGEFQPFTVCAVDRAGCVHLADWTGAELRAGSTNRPGMVRTSSGRDQAEAERLRAITLAGLVPDPVAITPGVLDRFHRSHLPERGPFSVCMHRLEAETRSLTTISVLEGAARLEYLPGAPCEGAAPTELRLPLVAGS